MAPLKVERRCERGGNASQEDAIPKALQGGLGVAIGPLP